MGKPCVKRDHRERDMIAMLAGMLRQPVILDIPITLPMKIGIIKHETGTSRRRFPTRDYAEKVQDWQKLRPTVVLEILKQVILIRKRRGVNAHQMQFRSAFDA